MPDADAAKARERLRRGMFAEDFPDPRPEATMTNDATLFVSDRPHSYGCEVALGSPAGQVVMIAHATWLPKGEAQRLTARVVAAANAHADLLAACRLMLGGIDADPHDSIHTSMPGGIHAMRAAVAKATGVAETPDAAAATDDVPVSPAM